MAKTDWITWKTNHTEVINPDNILTEVKDIISPYKEYMNNVVSFEIKEEINKGGLNPNSLNILGTSPANEEAKKIISSIDRINDSINKLINKINSKVVEQKMVEKQELIEAITYKLLEEESKLNNTLNLKDKIQDNNSVISISEINDIIEITTERIKRLKERLDLAKSL